MRAWCDGPSGRFSVTPRSIATSRRDVQQAATSLSQWQVFQNENPDTFVGMYQFWIQKGTDSV